MRPFTFRTAPHTIGEATAPVALVDPHPLFLQRMVSAFGPFTLLPQFIFIVVIRPGRVIILARVPESDSGGIFLWEQLQP